MVWRPVSSLHISRHHLHIVSVNVDERGRRLNRDFIHRRSKRITSELERSTGCTRLTAASSVPTTRSAGWTYRRAMSSGRYRM